MVRVINNQPYNKKQIGEEKRKIIVKQVPDVRGFYCVLS